MADKNIVVKHNPEQPIATEVLAESIQAIADGMRKIRQGRLNDRGLIVLLKDSTGVPLYEIKKVLDGMEALASIYLKKKVAK